MSGGAASGPHSTAIAQADRDRKSDAASTAGRAAARAIARWHGVTHAEEVDTLNAQIAELDEESDKESAKEYAIIQARFKALAADYNAKGAMRANEDLDFACAICFENKQIGTLRILPCGHGFCYRCTDAVIAAAGSAQATCPNCRAPVTDVIIPRF